MTTVKDGIEEVIEFSFHTNNRTLAEFLEERRGTDQIKIHRECQRTIYNVLKRCKVDKHHPDRIDLVL